MPSPQTVTTSALVLHCEWGSAGQSEPPLSHPCAMRSGLLSESVSWCPGESERSGRAGFVSSCGMAEEVALRAEKVGAEE